MATQTIDIKVGIDYTSIVELMREFDRQIKESNHSSVNGGTYPISHVLKECYGKFLVETFNPERKE